MNDFSQEEILNSCNDHEENGANAPEESVTPEKDAENVEIFLQAEETSSDSAKQNQKERKPKRERTVPLAAFVSSLLAAVILACTFASALYGIGHRFGYLEGIAENPPLYGDTNMPSFGAGTDYEELQFIDAFFKMYSYYDLSDIDVMSSLLKAYVAATGDIYAEYYTAEEMEAFNAESAGQGVGIGVSVIYSSVEINGTSYGAMELVSVMPNTPAEKSGVLPGDYVLYVGVGENRELVQSIGYTEALNRMRGEPGTKAEFVVYRPEANGTFREVEFSITREEYEVQSVTYRVSETDPTVGIVQILQFDLPTPAQFSEAMDALIRQGIKKFVFDVRNNPGGNLDSIVCVLSYFLEKNDLIVSTVDRSGSTEEHRALPGTYHCGELKEKDIGKYRGYEMAVLANGNTASAAELFTSALRDYELATIVGETTYGKGSVQSVYELYYWGYEGGIKLTTKHYFPPSGEDYHGVGIAPHIEVLLSEEAQNTHISKLPENQDDQLLAAISALQ